MTAGRRETTVDFLQSFFAAPNRFTLADILEGKAKRLAPWIDRVGETIRRSTVLPCWRSDRVEWYALAFSREGLAEMREELLAFVGPSFAAFNGLGTALAESDPIDQAVLEFTAGNAFKFVGPTGKEGTNAVLERLELMQAVRTRRPNREVERPRSTGRILRDFHLALGAGYGDEAEALLHTLGEQRRLDPLNLLFLRIQAFAALRRWPELLHLSELPDLLQMRRPLAVSEALLTAVYEVELRPFEDAADLNGLISHFKNIVSPQYASLFLRRSGLRAQNAVKMLMLHAVASTPTDPELRDAMLAIPDLTTETRTFLEKVAALLPSVAEASRDPIADAREAATEGNFDRALSLAIRADPSITRARLLLECAYELQSLEAAAAAGSAVSELSDADRASALSGRLFRLVYDQLTSGTEASAGELRPGEPAEIIPFTGPAEQSVPTNWEEWVTLVRAGHTNGLARIAREGASQWSVEEFLDLPSGIEVLTTELQDPTNLDVVQEALPHLLAFFQRDVVWPRQEFVPVYQAMLELVAYGSHGSDTDLLVAYDLLQALLPFGPDAERYKTMIEFTRHLLTAFDSVSRVGWGLDVLDLLIAQSAPLPHWRIDIMLNVAGLFQKHRRRVSPGQWEFFHVLCDDLGQRETFEALVAETPAEVGTTHASESELLDGLANRSVAIYTLTESAGRRVQQFLAARVPSATVSVNTDKVGSDGLRHLAKNADIFVMITASAKHAATEFIEAHRPKGDPRRPLLRPRGKGSASILEAVYEQLRRERDASRAIAA